MRPGNHNKLNMNKFCHHCGFSIPLNAQFCSQCGTSVLESLSADLPVPSGVQPPPLPIPQPQPVPQLEPLPELPVPKLGSPDLNKISRQGDRKDAACLCVIAG